MIKPLTSLRFVFAFMIFLYHLGGLFYGFNQEFLLNSPASYLSFKEGCLGVSFFFILSGFILAYNYKNKFLAKTISYKKFVLARIFRIYPLHILTFLYAFFRTIFGVYASIEYWFKALINVSLIQSLAPLKSYFLSFNGVSWSISNEMFFYLLFPTLIVAMSVKRNVFSVGLLTFFLGLLFLSNFFEAHWFFYINPFFRIFDFIIGLAIYEVYNKIKNYSWTNTKATILELLSISVFVLFYFMSQYVEQKLKWSLFFWFSMAFIILVFALQNGKISKLLSSKAAILLGEISFSFYMIYQLIIQFLGLVNYKFDFFKNGYLLIFIAFISSIGISVLVHFYFEKPVNQYLRKKYIN